MILGGEEVHYSRPLATVTANISPTSSWRPSRNSLTIYVDPVRISALSERAILLYFLSFSSINVGPARRHPG